MSVFVGSVGWLLFFVLLLFPVYVALVAYTYSRRSPGTTDRPTNQPTDSSFLLLLLLCWCCCRCSWCSSWEEEKHKVITTASEHHYRVCAIVADTAKTKLYIYVCEKGKGKLLYEWLERAVTTFFTVPVVLSLLRNKNLNIDNCWKKKRQHLLAGKFLTAYWSRYHCYRREIFAPSSSSLAVGWRTIAALDTS